MNIENIEQTINTIGMLERVGIPLVICAFVIFLLVKYVPRWIEIQLKIKEQQQEYYKKRQADYNAQMEVQNQLIRQAGEQQAISTEVIRCNNAIVEGNTKALQENSASNERLCDLIIRTIDDFKILEKQMEKMNGIMLNQIVKQLHKE